MFTSLVERVANAAETQQEEIRQEGIGLGKKKNSKRWWISLFAASILLYFTCIVGVLKIYKDVD